MKLMICGYLRPSVAFGSMESLIEAIKNDVTTSDAALDEQFLPLSKHEFFAKSPNLENSSFVLTARSASTPE